MGNMEERWDCSTACKAGYVLECSNGDKVLNKTVRFTFYKLITYEKFGHLGRGNRVKIPDCVENKVKALFPELDSSYTYFSPGQGEDVLTD